MPMVLPEAPPRRPPPPTASGSSKINVSNDLLRAFGLEIEQASPDKVTGPFQVTPECCQLFMVLHGGVLALIAGELGGIGAYLASGWRRAAGIRLSISHLKSAQVGDIVLAEATPLAEPTPVNAGKTVQVWEVQFWKADSSNSQNRSLIASARVTVLCKTSENAKDGEENFKQAKL